MVECWFCLPPLEHSDYLGNWGLQSPGTPVQVLPRGCKKGRSCLIPTLTTQLSTSTGRLLVHLRHQAAASRNRPCRSWTRPASLGKPVGGRGSLAFWWHSYSSRSFCPKGSFDVQNRLWCQYESSIVQLGTDNALGRLFIYKSTQCSPLPFSLQTQTERPSSCKSNRLLELIKIIQKMLFIS